ncbi:MAG: hypothetical protein GAK41_00986 [Burkholderia gladioli]|nr:MAG: hypothetical protein GAK41_00986 [Burkholderia gladioli]
MRFHATRNESPSNSGPESGVIQEPFWRVRCNTTCSSGCSAGCAWAASWLLIYLLDLSAVVYISSILIHEKYMSIDFSQRRCCINRV